MGFTVAEYAFDPFDPSFSFPVTLGSIISDKVITVEEPDYAPETITLSDDGNSLFFLGANLIVCA